MTWFNHSGFPYQDPASENLRWVLGLLGAVPVVGAQEVSWDLLGWDSQGVPRLNAENLMQTLLNHIPTKKTWAGTSQKTWYNWYPSQPQRFQLRHGDADILQMLELSVPRPISPKFPSSVSTWQGMLRRLGIQTVLHAPTNVFYHVFNIFPTKLWVVVSLARWNRSPTREQSSYLSLSESHG